MNWPDFFKFRSFIEVVKECAKYFQIFVLYVTLIEIDYTLRVMGRESELFTNSDLICSEK